MSFVCIVTWNLVHWIYAYKYLTLSLILPSAKNFCGFQIELKHAQILNIAMIANIVGLQGLYMILELVYRLKNNSPESIA